ncbi:hypothetical protein KC345_g11955, partial [Hortaea werneckii]
MQLNQPVTEQKAVLETGGLIIDPDRRSVTLYGNPIELTPKEFDILYLLASYPKKVFSAEHLFRQIWGEAYYEGGNTVMVHIRTLRKKLGEEQTKNTFRFKMISLLVLSMICSGAITFALYKGLQLYYYSNVKLEDPLARFRWMIASFGDLNFFLIFFIPLALLFFFLFTKPYARYFKEISQHIRLLANGDFKSRIVISSSDEFEDIAADLNLAKDKLQQAVERGDFAENSKDKLVLNLAHDLRTPLTSVLGYLDLVLKDRQLSAEQIKHYTTIAYTKS